MNNARVPYSIIQFKLYEDYLDSKLTEMDLVHLKSKELARNLVELGLKGPVLNREEFEEKKAAALAAEAERTNKSSNQPVKLASAGKEIKDNFLRALAEREEANRSGKMTVSTLLQHSNCYVMGFPSNISAILLGWEQNLYCVKFTQNAPHSLPKFRKQ
ncbi:unnamed protein product [Tetraodon nigroviridis]|uniref:Cilia- and flagella-associated protein 299 n=1 Tax=Tetraodon nigroviridis TaxID=99883 RepID=Q4RPQ7_TETNG|nr:unnamed protein product [Tetraodon nigroviridis]